MGMTETKLPAVTVVSAVRPSDRSSIHVTNTAIGRWIENESSKIAGPIREVLLADPAIGDPEQIVEVQVPISSS
jgi:effector-binding domain-containing protein